MSQQTRTRNANLKEVYSRSAFLAWLKSKDPCKTFIESENHCPISQFLLETTTEEGLGCWAGFMIDHELAAAIDNIPAWWNDMFPGDIIPLVESKL